MNGCEAISFDAKFHCGAVVLQSLCPIRFRPCMTEGLCYQARPGSSGCALYLQALIRTDWPNSLSLVANENVLLAAS